MSKIDRKIKRTIQLAKGVGRSNFADGGAPDYNLDNNLLYPNFSIPKGMGYSPVNVLSGQSTQEFKPTNYSPVNVLSGQPDTEFKPVDYSSLISNSSGPGPFSPVGPMTGSLDIPPLANLDLYKGAPVAQTDPNSPFAPPKPSETVAPTQDTSTSQWEPSGGGGDHGDYGVGVSSEEGENGSSTDAGSEGGTESGTEGGDGGGNGGSDGGSGGGGEAHGGAITMRRYKTNGGPIIIAPIPTPTLPPLADLDIYKGAPLNKPPESPLAPEESKQEDVGIIAPPTLEPNGGGNGGGMAGGPPSPDFAPDMGPPSSAASGPFGGLATAAGYGPGMTVGNTVGGLVGGVLGSVVGGPVGGLVGGVLGRHAANAITDQNQDESVNTSDQNGGLGPASDSSPEAASQSGETSTSAESATANMQNGGAITVRRYKANGGPIKITPAQARAGNYKKKHLNFNGLPIAIETPKGHIREKVVNGKVDWRVKMPADYGYVKETKDNDGDATDVFVGPDKKSDRVWVIDQAHLHNGKFDEHKAMLGFNSKYNALKTYKDSFADGKGHKRIQNVTKMSVDAYKDWVKTGNLKKPVASNPLITKALSVVSKKK